MNDQDLCRLIDEFRNNLMNMAIERRVINELVTKGTRHHLCRFAAQLELESSGDDAAGRFVQGLQDVNCPEHVLRWVRIVRLLEGASKHSDFVTDLCDLLEAEDKVLATAIENEQDCLRIGPDERPDFQALQQDVFEANVALLSGLCNYRPES